MSRSESRSAPSIADHELIARIGRGSYGEVWPARNRTTNTLRAVKVVFRDELEDERPYRRERSKLGLRSRRRWRISIRRGWSIGTSSRRISSSWAVAPNSRTWVW
jgi:hypothetical protein